MCFPTKQYAVNFENKYTGNNSIQNIYTIDAHCINSLIMFCHENLKLRVNVHYIRSLIRVFNQNMTVKYVNKCCRNNSV